MKHVLKRLSLLALSLALVMAAALPCWAADTAAAPTDAPAETEEMAEMPEDGAAAEGDAMPEMGPPQIQLAEGDEVDLGFNVEKATMIIAIVFAVAAVAVLGLFIFRAVRIRSVRKVASALLCVVLVALLVLNIAVARFNVVVNQFLSGQGSSDEITAAEEASKAKTQELEGEGIVLLKNEGDSLPLSEKKVNVFGYGSYAPAYGGAGSGAGDETKNVSVKGGLEAAGFTVNEDLVAFYGKVNTGEYEGNVFNMMGNDFNIYEPAVSEYGDLIDSAKEFSDTAIVVISRAGGEGADLPMDMAGYTGGTPGRHYLELTENEEDMLAMVEENFGTVIVIVNSSHAVELGFLEDEAVDAAIWIGCPGSTGMNAVGEVLSGKVNPSGRLVDTYAYDATSAPSYYNFGDFSYSNTLHTTQGMMGSEDAYYKFLDYAEGIYVGYRYYETRYVDNETGVCDEEAYQAAVQFPFGYGLSYTTFEQTMSDLTVSDGNISVDVTVTNTGDVAGKEVVQLYYTAPYTVGGIEKSHVVLAAFDKTDLLQPGASQTLTLTFAVDDMASFDYLGAGCYVLDAGDYEIKLMSNAHDVIDSRTYTVDSTVTYNGDNSRASDLIAAETAFAEYAGDVQYVSRADWEGTLPTERTADREASAELIAAIEDCSVPEDPNAEPIVIKDNGLTLADVIGLDYDDPKWEQLLEQLSVEDMANLITTGGYQTISIASVSKPATVDIDGPAGLNGLVNGISGVQFCSEVVMASTWNQKLVEEMGECLGDEALANGVTGLYGPGADTHRSPFGGRNFEYFSEDGLLAGKMAAAEIRGAMSRGCYTYVKHYALNDQDTNRSNVCTWANEQAIREIYLKPFEIAVKEGGTTAVMSAMNNIGTDWVGASKALCTTTLRDEWGFRGMVITDAYGNGMDISSGIAAGNDLALSITGGITIRNTDSNTVQQQMRTACHNILYAVANSNAYALINYDAPWWLWLLGGVDVVALGLIAVGFVAATRRKQDAGKAKK
ncbi:MAG: glycoside hydrolase family 3 C-terminal domain-containing protein [Candidatus Onthomonas sp.]